MPDIHQIEYLNEEAYLCGAMAIDERAIDLAVKEVTPEDFDSDVYRDVFVSIIESRQDTKEFDLLAAVERLSKKGYGDEKARNTILGVMEATGTAANTQFYINRVIDRANKRSIEETFKKMSFIQKTSGEELADALRTSIESMRKVTREGDIIKPMDISSSIANSLTSEKRNFSLSTGYKSLNERLGGGIMNGNLVILAGRPGMGKTTFGLSLAENIMDNLGKEEKILFVSLEMSPEEIFAKRASKLCGVPAIDILISDTLDEKQIGDITMSLRELHNKPFLMNKSSPLSVTDIEGLIDADEGIKCVFIDHVGLISPSRTMKGKSTNDIVSDITKNLKQLAKRKKIPIIALCQLSRKVEERGDKHPVMSDLRDSGSIEQDADVVMLLYRDDYYSGVTRKYWEPSELELILGKSRFGSTGTLKFDVYFGTETIAEKAM